MSRLFTFVVLCVALPDVGHAAPLPDAPPEKAYFTTTKGTALVYRYIGTDDKGQPDEGEVTNIVTAVATTDAGTVVTLSHRHEGSLYAATDTYLLSEKGLFTIGTSMTGPDVKGERRWEIDPPACLLKLPHEEGTEWEFHCTAQPGGLVGVHATNAARAPEDVVVPAGTYRAVRVEQRGTTNGKETTATFWYAPEIGLVKMVSEGVVQELKLVIPATEAPQP